MFDKNNIMSIVFNPSTEDDITTRIGGNIHKERLKKGVTQTQMSYEVGTSTSVISCLENGKRSKVHLATLIKIANYFEITLQELLA
jgi:transcriptional regulator with XRE-family HTH domain